jgi:hypothetical protein
MASPFRVGGAVTGEYFTNRAREVDEIYRAMRDPARLLVRGLRRQGKTSSIAQAAQRFRTEGGVVIWADLATLAQLSDLRDRLVSSIPSGFFGAFEGLRKLEPVLEVILDPVTGRQSYRFRAARRPERDLGVREQIRVLIESIDRRVADTGRRVAIVLDEVQAITLLGEERADWFLRDLMQSAPNLSFICAGSQPSILRAMTEDRHAAFFRFFSPGPVFGAMEKEHLGRWIASRLTGAGVRCPDAMGLRIAEIGDRTQDIILFADEVYAAGRARGRADEDVLREALDALLLKESDRYQRVWDELTSNQRVVVRALAAGETSLYAHDAALPLAGSSVHRAVEGLRKKGVLQDTPGPEMIDDPFFREWLLRFALADSVPEEFVDGGPLELP